MKIKNERIEQVIEIRFLINKIETFEHDIKTKSK